MEIYDEDQLTEYELKRQRNIISNYEFMKSCGLPVKPLLYVKNKRPDDHMSDDEYHPPDSDDDDPWFPNQNEAKKFIQNEEKKNESSNKYKPTFKKVRNPCAIFGIPKPHVEEKDMKSVRETRKQASKDRRRSTEETHQTQLVKKRRKIDPIRKRWKSGCTSSTTVVKEEDDSWKIEYNRYPRRKLRVDYTEAEVPDDDHYLFCEECGDFNHGDCPIHGPLVPVEDAEVPDDAMTATKARASLPNGLEIKTSSIPNAGLGVFAKDNIESGVRFGPYQGKKIHKDSAYDRRDTSYMWEIMKDGDVCYYIDGKDESIGNWLRFINCARTETEQNLVAYQYHNDIYYRAYKNIPIGQELLVWYGDEYALDLGIDDAADAKKDVSNELWRDKVKKCERCGIYFQANTLQSHIQYCRGRKNKVKSNTDETMVNNSNVNGKKKQFLYDTDGQGSNLPASVKAHKKYQKGYFHSCDICGKRFTASNSLKRHQLIHTGEKPYSCDICGKRFTVSRLLKIHQSVHTGERPYSCDICGKRFVQSGDLKKHQLIHTGEKPYSCDICGKRFTASNSLKTHQLIHTGEKPYSCDICGKRFNLSGNLKTHQLIHTGEKPYSCDICGQRFTASSSLKTHQLIHTGEKPYSCDICGKRFNDPRNLKTHKLIHTGEKPYSCDICEKRFTSSCNLKTHQLIHTGEKPYSCDICGQRFNQAGNLKIHQKIHKTS